MQQNRPYLAWPAVTDAFCISFFFFVSRDLFQTRKSIRSTPWKKLLCRSVFILRTIGTCLLLYLRTFVNFLHGRHIIWSANRYFASRARSRSLRAFSCNWRPPAVMTTVSNAFRCRIDQLVRTGEKGRLPAWQRWSIPLRTRSYLFTCSPSVWTLFERPYFHRRCICHRLLRKKQREFLWQAGVRFAQNLLKDVVHPKNTSPNLRLEPIGCVYF